MLEMLDRVSTMEVALKMFAKRKPSDYRNVQSIQNALLKSVFFADAIFDKFVLRDFNVEFFAFIKFHICHLAYTLFLQATKYNNAKKNK